MSIEHTRPRSSLKIPKMQIFFWKWATVAGNFFLGGESPLQAGWDLYLVYQKGFAFMEA
jgi:hypothetical protein